jgi:hypothetical protein
MHMICNMRICTLIVCKQRTQKSPSKFFFLKSNMGWDSDSDDAIDIDAQLAAKNAAKKTYVAICVIVQSFF